MKSIGIMTKAGKSRLLKKLCNLSFEEGKNSRIYFHTNNKVNIYTPNNGNYKLYSLWLKSSKINYISRYSKTLFSCNIQSKSFHTSILGMSMDQTIPRSSEEVKELLNQTPISDPNSKLLKIAILGVPNSGKSTLVNQLIGWKVCSVSQKVHTTRCNSRAVYNDESTQLVYLDTPGIVSPEEITKYKLNQSLIIDPEKSLLQADLIAVLHDVSNRYTRHTLHPRILRLLLLYPSIPSVLIINKVDLLKKKYVLLSITKKLTEGVVGNEKIPVINRHTTDEDLRNSILGFDSPEEQETKESLDNPSQLDVDYTQNFDDKQTAINQLDDRTRASLEEYEKETSDISVDFEDVLSGKVKPNEKQVTSLAKGMIGWPKFQQVFMISALDGTGVEEVKQYFISSAKKGQWIFTDDVVTDQSPQEMALMAVREKCLEYLDHNIPYELKYKLLYWDLSEAEVLSILIGVYCKNKSFMKIVIGPKGSKVRKIARQAEQDLRNTFRTEVRLRLNFEYDPNIKDSQI